MKRRSRAKLVWAALALIPVLVGVWWFASAFEGEAAREIEVVRGDLLLGVEVTGTLRAVESTFLGPPQGGHSWQFRIAHMAPEGQEVIAGMPVLTFDSSDLQQKLQELQAEGATAEKEIEEAEKDLEVERRDNKLQLNEEKARLRKARLKMDRPEELQKGQDLAIARLDLESTELSVAHLERREELSARVAEARKAGLQDQRDRALQRIQEARDAIQEMNRIAPRNGTVIYVTDWAGEKKNIGDTCWKGEKVIELPDLSAMLAEGRVDEADAGKLAEGQRVTLRLDAHPDQEFTGRVASISKTFQPQSWSNPLKIASLEIELDSTDTKRMRPGMRFRGRIETESVTDALLLPLDAVEVTPEGPVAYRRGLLGGEPVRLELGRRNATQVEVLDGLREGEIVERIAVTAEGT